MRQSCHGKPFGIKLIHSYKDSIVIQLILLTAGVLLICLPVYLGMGNKILQLTLILVGSLILFSIAFNITLNYFNWDRSQKIQGNRKVYGELSPHGDYPWDFNKNRFHPYFWDEILTVSFVLISSVCLSFPFNYFVFSKEEYFTRPIIVTTITIDIVVIASFFLLIKSLNKLKSIKKSFIEWSYFPILRDSEINLIWQFELTAVPSDLKIAVQAIHEHMVAINDHGAIVPRYDIIQEQFLVSENIRIGNKHSLPSFVLPFTWPATKLSIDDKIVEKDYFYTLIFISFKNNGLNVEIHYLLPVY